MSSRVCAAYIAKMAVGDAGATERKTVRTVHKRKHRTSRLGRRQVD
jgi:hypothetical protein